MAWNSGFRKVELETDSAILANAFVGFKALFVERGMCMLCTCVILVAIVIGLSFGLGVFKNGFHKVKDHLGVCDPDAIGSLCGGGKVSRPFLGFPASPPGPF
ncbi:hypothetical protein POTOM_041497 [Populus tomentosa]|uniref:Uncharacterized protein n=1 Tax=Populus tomentosa TaxID=118781 RepID=A0A8X8CJ69_POPTO|nr:hypothetical protein POTOM_041497 [Populus tomentosa]